MSNFTDLIETKLSKPLERVEFTLQWKPSSEVQFVGVVTNHGSRYHNVRHHEFYGRGTSDGVSKCGITKMWSAWWFVTAEDVQENNINACKVCFPQDATKETRRVR